MEWVIFSPSPTLLARSFLSPNFPRRRGIKSRDLEWEENLEGWCTHRSAMPLSRNRAKDRPTKRDFSPSSFCKGSSGLPAITVRQRKRISSLPYHPGPNGTKETNYHLALFSPLSFSLPLVINSFPLPCCPRNVSGCRVSYTNIVAIPGSFLFALKTKLFINYDHSEEKLFQKPFLLPFRSSPFKNTPAIAKRELSFKKLADNSRNNGGKHAPVRNCNY